MQNLLVVAETKNYLLMSLKSNLEGALYQVIVVPPDTNAINKVKEPITAIIIYADVALTEQTAALNFLKDRVIMDDLPIFAIGNLDELNVIKSIIPKDIIRREFLRPIYVHDVGEEIDTFLKEFCTQNRKKILVVDDSGAMLRNVKGWLGDKYDVYLANSGAMAIKYLALNRPDLVLLDYEMPVVDGRQVLEMIRSEMEFATIPVMFLTNKGDKESIMRVKELKPQGYLLKSVEPAIIVKTIDDFFEKRKGLI